MKDTYKFESQLINKVAEFLQQCAYDDEITITISDDHSCNESSTTDGESENDQRRMVSFKGAKKSSEEVKKLMLARGSGISYMIGNVYVMANDASPFLKKIAITVYGFLRQNCRRPSNTLGVPHTSLIEVGTAYRV